MLGSFHNQGSIVANGYVVCTVYSVLISALNVLGTFFLAIIWDKVIILDEIGRWMCCLFACMYMYVMTSDFLACRVLCCVCLGKVQLAVRSP